MTGRIRTEELTGPLGGSVAFPGGMTFPNRTLGNNVLDWYEEGTYSPTISYATTAGSWGNSTSSGIFCRIGNIVTISIKITIGSTWSAGTGTMSIAPPYPPVQDVLVDTLILDNSAVVYYPGVWRPWFGTLQDKVSPMNTWSNSIPVALEVNDYILISGSYVTG